MKALIYEPDPFVLKKLSDHLRRLGLTTVVVKRTAGLLRKIETGNFDMLILNERRKDLIDRLEKFEKEIPIIITLSKVKPINNEHLIAPYTVAVIRKPYHFDMIQNAVARAVKYREKILMGQRSLASLRQKVRELETLNEIVQAINSSLKPKDVLQNIMAKTAGLIKAEGWSILLLDREKQELVFEAAAGEAGKKLIGMRLKIGQGVAGWVAEKRESLIVADVSQDPRFYSGVDKKTKFTTKSILCVPMKSRDEIIGVVEVVNKIGGEPFTKDDLAIFENLVEHVTIALQNAQLYHRMEETSLTDDLTKLYNSRYCNQVLDELLKERFAKASSRVSLIFFDVDFFKLVDDNYGHLVGSDTLKLIGERLKRVIREKDIAVRYGGDEYIVILPDTDKKTAALIAERIRKEICQKPFYAFDNKKFTVSVTLGVATYPDDAHNRDDLIGKADRAMYEGKMTGRNKVVLA